MRWLLLVALAGCGLSAQERANLEMQCHSMPCPELKKAYLSVLKAGGPLVCYCGEDFMATAKRQLEAEDAERERQWRTPRPVR